MEDMKMKKGKTKLGKKLEDENINEQNENIVINAKLGEKINEESAEKEFIVSSYATFKQNEPQKTRIRRGRQLKNTAKFLMDTIAKMYFLSLWKRQVNSLKYTKRGYNANRANFKIFIKNIATTINNHQYSYLNEILDKMKKNEMPSKMNHNKNYGKIKIVDDDIMNKKCLEKFLNWINIFPYLKEKKLIIEAFNQISQNKNKKIKNKNFYNYDYTISNSTIYTRPKNIKNNYKIIEYKNKRNVFIFNNKSNVQYISEYDDPIKYHNFRNIDSSHVSRKVIYRSPIINKIRQTINRNSIINRTTRIPNSYCVSPASIHRTIQNNNFSKVIYVNKRNKLNINNTKNNQSNTYEIRTTPYKHQNNLIKKYTPKSKDNYRFYESQHINNINDNKKYVHINQNTSRKKNKYIKYVSKVNNQNEFLIPRFNIVNGIRIKNIGEKKQSYYLNRQHSPLQKTKKIYINDSKNKNNLIKIPSHVRKKIINRYYGIDKRERVISEDYGNSIEVRCKKCGGIIPNYYGYKTDNMNNYKNTYLDRKFSSVRPEKKCNRTYYCIN